MLSKRHTELLKLLENEGTIAIADLAARFDVTLETIRRDIKPLADSGRLVKMHGAVCLPGELGEAPFQKRMRENADAKRSISKFVASTVEDGDSLMLDTGTTTSFVARELIQHRHLTIVTNSTDIARTLASVNGNRVYLAGGEIRADSGATFGASAVNFLSKFTVKHAIITAGALSNTAGIMDFDIEEAEIARMILTRGERRIVVCDNTKFGKRGLVNVCSWQDLTDLVTNTPPPLEFATVIKSASCRLHISQKN